MQLKSIIQSSTTGKCLNSHTQSYWTATHTAIKVNSLQAAATTACLHHQQRATIHTNSTYNSILSLSSYTSLNNNNTLSCSHHNRVHPPRLLLESWNVRSFASSALIERIVVPDLGEDV